MTSFIKLSSFLLLVSNFAWAIETETFLTTEGDVEEEEEERISDAVFGNETLRMPPLDPPSSPLPPPADDPSLPDSNDLWRKESNLTDYDDLPSKAENVIVEGDVNDFSPEAEERSLEDDSFFTNATFESSLPTDPLVPQDLVATSNCTFGARKCPKVDEEERPKKADDFIMATPVANGFPTSPLWSNVMKSLRSLREDFTRLRTIRFTPIRSTRVFPTLAPTKSTRTLAPGSSTGETSENVIVVDENSKDESLDSHKNEKAKPGLRDESQPSSDELHRNFFKISSTPAVLVPKEAVSPVSTQPLNSFRAMAEVLPSESFEEVPVKATSVFVSKRVDMVSKDIDHPFNSIKNENDDFNKSHPFDQVKSSQLLENITSVILLSGLEPNIISRIPLFGEKPSKTSPDLLPQLTPLLPSFSEVTPTESSFSETTTSTFSITDVSSTAFPTPEHFTPALSPEVNTPFIARDHPMPTTRMQEVPPPRLTHPGCSSLPVCVEVTLLQTTWDEFCENMLDFQDFLSRSVSQYTRPVKPYHIVLDTELCAMSSSARPHQATPDVTVPFFVTDESGEYEERLTDICGLVLRKWAPTAYRNSIMEVRLFNAETQTLLPVMPEFNSGFIAAVAISAVAGVALCLLCILLIVMRQKMGVGRGASEATPASADSFSLDSLSISASFRRRRNRKSARSYLNHAFSDQEIPSHPLNERTLGNCLKNKDLLAEEFRKIPMTMPKLESIPEGAHVKNRYSNILPRPESRVIISESSGDEFKSYINANYVKGYAGEASFYIACQAPLSEGVEDFWRMAWERQARVVVMLTRLDENGVSRCASYLPHSTLVTQPPYGDFQLTLLKKEVYEFYTLSSLRLLDIEKNLFRDVTHLWFTGWPDVGVPKDASTLVAFVQQARPFLNRNPGPTIVHCSTGTGRTGVFLALDMLTREYDESRSLDVLQCVARMRADRAGAVQNKDQYVLIHEAMLEYVSQSANQSQRLSVSSKVS